MKGCALVIDDHDIWLEFFKELLTDIELDVYTADNFHDAVNLIDARQFHLVLVDLRLKDDEPENMEGMNILSYINQSSLNKNTVKIVITGYGTRDSARESFKKYNVQDYIPKIGPDGAGFDEDVFIQNLKSAFFGKYNISL